MFTGIIETLGIVRTIGQTGTNKTFWIESPISPGLTIDQSLSHDGACLTVEETRDSLHRVTAIDETIKKTTLGQLREGDSVNLERCMVMNGRLDGHIVQGHVDATAVCTDKKEKQGSWEFTFEFPRAFTSLVIEKGSICLNGISLTLFDVRKKHFSVAIIPYTYEHTNISRIVPGSMVNLEFDMIGKYVSRMMMK